MSIDAPLAPIDSVIQSSQEDYISIDVHVGGQDRTFNLPCDYELWSYVGRGSFGCVYHYKDTDSNLDLAMKCIPTQDCGDLESEKRTVQNEITIHRRLSHPNIVKYFTTKQIDNIFLIFMEYVAGESLFDRVERAGPLNSNLVIDFTYQILSGLVYMHSQEIVHRDLRSKNILISSANVVKIVDFGISKSFTDTHCSLFSSQVGHPHWRAPELIEGRGKAGRKVDVWSLGIAMFEMIRGDTPWGELDSETAQYHIYKNTLKLPLPEDTPTNLASLVNLCLERDCEKRKASKELIKNSIFSHYHTLES
ncbi:hypothetical protein ACHWQZ_G007271 [Mnemiopsis leidyi]